MNSKVKKYKIVNLKQRGGVKPKPLINFPFKYMYSKHSKIDTKWVLGDKIKGESLPTNDFRKFYPMINQILFYKEGWGTEPHISYLESEEPSILIAKLYNNVYVYIYSTSDYTGYSCINNHYDVIYSHNLNKLYKYGLTEKVRQLLNIFLDEKTSK